MADNKQYITQDQECGKIMISEDVLVTIIAHAVTEVEGVSGLSVKPGSDIVDMIGVDQLRGRRPRARYDLHRALRHDRSRASRGQGRDR